MDEDGDGDSDSTAPSERPVRVAQSTQTATDARRVGPPAKPPAYRAGIPQKVWNDFNREVAALPGITPTEQYVYAKIFAAEGGVANDPNSSASSGILRQTLREARAKGVPGLANVTHPDNLTMAQRAKLYEFYIDRAFHTVNGGAGLDTIPDPQTAAALADTLFRHGNTRGTEVVQDSVNHILAGLPSDERRRLGLDSITRDGAMGQRTFDAVRQLDQAGYGMALRGAIADTRTARPNGSREKSRFDDFR